MARIQARVAAMQLIYEQMEGGDGGDETLRGLIGFVPQAAVTGDEPAVEEIPLDELALRYEQLEGARTGSLMQMFILAENITPHHGPSGSFDVLRDSVVEYLNEVRAAHRAADKETS